MDEIEEMKDQLSATIPKNFKSGKYVASLYKPVDFTILLMDIFFTLIFFFAIFIQDENIIGRLCLLFIISLLVFSWILPVPYYHSVYKFLKYLKSFYMSPKIYVWKGINLDEDE